MTAIYAGTTMECLEHLKRAVQDEDYIDMRQKIAAFTGVIERTVDRWFSESMEPAGESLLRLRFYLDFLGYDVAELRELQEPVRDTGRIVAFGITSLADLAKLVGYQEGRSGIDVLLRLFRGHARVPSTRLDDFGQFVELTRTQLTEKQLATPKVIVANRRYPSLGTSSMSAVQSIKPTHNQAPDLHAGIIETYARQVQAMIPLGKMIESDAFTPQERARLRELCGDGTFTLSNILFRLCGERSRDMHSHSTREKE